MLTSFLSEIDQYLYTSFLEQFGSAPISKEQIEKIEKATGKKAHHFLRRGIFFSQRCE